MIIQPPLKEVDIFTDGACSGNPGPGGWAAILRYGDKEKEISGSMPHTTNNRMEIFAAISALGALKFACKVRIYSDSSYMVSAFNQGWLDKWKHNGWKTADGKQVENQDMWRLILLTIEKHGHQVEFIKVEGHSGHPENERCDKLAKGEIDAFLKLNPDYLEIMQKVNQIRSVRSATIDE